MTYSDGAAAFRFSGTAIERGPELALALPAIVHCTDMDQATRLSPLSGRGARVRVGGLLAPPVALMRVSMAGFIAGPCPVSPGSAYVVQLYPTSAAEQPIQLEALCRWSRPEAADGAAVGFSFLSLQGPQREALLHGLRSLA